MTKESLYEAMGDMSEKWIEGAEETMKTKKKNTWVKWGAVAACLAVAVLLGASLRQAGQNSVGSGDVSPETAAADSVQAGEGRMGGGKRMINFEGRVTAIDGDKVTLEGGKIVRVAEDAVVASPDGGDAEIAVGDYIQGYAENADADEIDARFILVTTL